MSDRPSDGMTLDELREEFDWIFEFQSRMAERIRGDADVHSLADYVDKLEAENAKLQDELEFANNECERAVLELLDQQGQLEAENAKLRESVKRLMTQRDERLASAEAENAKLRERCHYLMKGDLLHVLTDQEYIDQCERERLMQVSIDALDKENAKLRELIRELFRDFANADYELKSRCGRTFMAVTRYLPRLQELEVEP